jgi:hypothetical protein
MQDIHTITLVSRVREGSVNESIEAYLQRGYIIQSAVKYVSLEDNNMAIRFELKRDLSLPHS